MEGGEGRGRKGEGGIRSKGGWKRREEARWGEKAERGSCDGKR